MSDHDHDHEGFSVFKIFIMLFVLTALEVVYGEIGNRMFYENKLLLWGGLMLFAIWKGFLILMYFMHMKFEGWIVKVLVLPTIPLMLVVVFALMPDISFNKRMNYDIADQLDPATGVIGPMPSGGGHGEGDDGH